MESYVFPGNIDEQIMKIGAQPFIYMRTDAFSEVNKESEQLLLDLIHCRSGRTIIYTGSGTGAMAAVVENYVTTGSVIQTAIKNKQNPFEVLRIIATAALA